MLGNNLDTYPPLTSRRLRFVEEYLVDLCATQAAIRAGFSPRTADVAGARLLRNVRVRQAIEVAKEERAHRVQLIADDVVRELMCLAFMDIGDAFDDQGCLKPLIDMPKEIRRAITVIEVSELFAGLGEDRASIGYTKKIKLSDKLRALELLTRHVNVRALFPQRMEISGPDGGEIPMGNTGMANRILFLLSNLEKRAKAALSDGKPAGS